MIKSTELRIGNWIKQAFGYCQVRGTAKNAIWLNDEGGTVLIDSFMLIEPIILTEEILLKCGFEKVENYNPMFIHCTSPLRIKANKYTQSKKIDCRISILKSNFFYQISRTVKVKLDYLHQLQNLYWCLCEKELICNLK